MYVKPELVLVGTAQSVVRGELENLIKDSSTSTFVETHSLMEVD